MQKFCWMRSTVVARSIATRGKVLGAVIFFLMRSPCCMSCASAPPDTSCVRSNTFQGVRRPPLAIKGAPTPKGIFLTESTTRPSHLPERDYNSIETFSSSSVQFARCMGCRSAADNAWRGQCMHQCKAAVAFLCHRPKMLYT